MTDQPDLRTFALSERVHYRDADGVWRPATVTELRYNGLRITADRFTTEPVTVEPVYLVHVDGWRGAVCVSDIDRLCRCDDSKP